MKEPLLGPRFSDALVYAADLHGRQLRKGTDVPYISHLLAVASLVLEDGGSEDEAVAALLHDAAEDQGGEATLADIATRFGQTVAAIVGECSDTFEDPKPEWRTRKVAFVAGLQSANPSTLRVELADKLHNARTIYADYLKVGDKLWDRFTGGKEGTLWYYRSLARAFRQASSGFLVDELERTVHALEDQLTRSGNLP